MNVFVVEVRSRFRAHCDKPLRTVGSHPDSVACLDGVVGVFEAVDALALEHEEAVFHDVGFDEGKGSAGLIGEDVDGEIEGGIEREKGLEAGVVEAEEGFTGDVAGEAVGDGRGSEIGQGLVDFAEEGDAGVGGAVEGEGSVGREVEEGGGGEVKGAIREGDLAGAGLDVERVFVVVSGEGSLIGLGIEGDEDLRKLSAHGGRDDDKGGGVFPTGELRRDVAIWSDERVAGGDGGAGLAEEVHGVLVVRVGRRKWPRVWSVMRWPRR